MSHPHPALSLNGEGFLILPLLAGGLRRSPEATLSTDSPWRGVRRRPERRPESVEGLAEGARGYFGLLFMPWWCNLGA